MRDERAVSETLGFILIFALITSSVAIVYVAGFQGLETARDAERITNAERAFDVLADNLEDIYHDGAPSRTTELKLADSTLSFGSDTRMNVTIQNLGGTPGQQSSEIKLVPLVYETNEADALVYEGGTVFRQSRGGAVVQDRVGMIFIEETDTRTAVIPFVQTRKEGAGETVSGSTTALVRAEHATTDVMIARTEPDADTDDGTRYDVRFEIATSQSRAKAWERYLEDEIPVSWDMNGDSDVCVVSSGTLTCDFEVDRLYVTVSRIDMTIE